jgi:hypothetical protein
MECDHMAFVPTVGDFYTREELTKLREEKAGRFSRWTSNFCPNCGASLLDGAP